MAKDTILTRITAWTLLTIIIVCGLVGYCHFNSQYRQAQREVIYLKAREMSIRERQQQMQDYQKRMQEQRLRQQYNQGRVAGEAPVYVID